MTFRTYITIPVKVTFSIRPGEEGLRDSMGVPETPDIDPEVEIHSVECEHHDLTAEVPNDEMESLIEQAWDHQKIHG